VDQTVWVFFVCAKQYPRGVKAKWRVLRRYPGRTFSDLVSFVARFRSGSPLAHVLIGDHRAVLERAIIEDVHYDPEAFWKSGIASWSIEVNVPNPIDWSRYPPRKYVGWWRRLISPFHNCVTVTADILRQTGEPVPRSVVTVHGLFEYLRSRGHDLMDMDPTPYERTSRPAHDPEQRPEGSARNGDSGYGRSHASGHLGQLDVVE